MITLALRYWHWIAMGLLCAAIGVQTTRMNHARTQVHKIAAERADERARAAHAAQAAEAAARIEEQRRAAAARKVIDEANTQTTAARADAVAAADAAAGLRLDLAAYVSRSRRAAGNPGAAIAGAPAADPLDLLANMFSSASETERELALYADAARIAGNACTTAYDSLTISPNH